MNSSPTIDQEASVILRRGIVIPAHPLALTAARKLNERRQVALTRYYCDAGVGGIAVGVHTTQFAIHDPKLGLLEPVLRLAIEAMHEYEKRKDRRLVKVAGIIGSTPQAISEASTARSLGYDVGLLSLAALQDSSVPELIEHCRCVSEVMPLFGFYLQPAVGGRTLDYRFWREFLEIENIVAIKVAPFDRYRTLDVARALIDSGRSEEVALYSGNDDNIVAELLAEFRLAGVNGQSSVHFAGGLLGHWAVWAKRAVELLEAVQECRSRRDGDVFALLTRGAEITDANAAFFDARNQFAGCIAGLHEVLRRQGLLEGRWCLNPDEDLSPGQMEEIDRIYAGYPHLNDDEFVKQNLEHWLN
jgi:dihydrodipicolinate synthase/N-acetylneuraminate lyase